MFLSLCLSVASPGQLHRLPWLSCFVSSNCLLCQLMKLICPNRCKRDLFCSARGQCSDQWTQDHTHRRTNTRSTASMALAELATQREMREKRRTKRVNAARRGSPRLAVWMAGLLLVTRSLCLTVCTLAGVFVRFSSRGGRRWPELEVVLLLFARIPFELKCDPVVFFVSGSAAFYC